MSGWLLENYRNKEPTCTPPPGGRLRDPTPPRLTANMNQSITESTKATNSTPIIYKATYQIVFNPDVPEFSPNTLTDVGGWLDLQASARAAHAAQ